MDRGNCSHSHGNCSAPTSGICSGDDSTFYRKKAMTGRSSRACAHTVRVLVRCMGHTRACVPYVLSMGHTVIGYLVTLDKSETYKETIKAKFHHIRYRIQSYLYCTCRTRTRTRIRAEGPLVRVDVLSIFIGSLIHRGALSNCQASDENSFRGSVLNTGTPPVYTERP